MAPKKLFVNINLENDPVSCVKVTGKVIIDKSRREVSLLE